jgi:hypothetical protein
MTFVPGMKVRYAPQPERGGPSTRTALAEVLFLAGPS